MKETRLRSLVKAFSWRVLGTVATSFVVLYYTKKLGLAFRIGFIDFGLKIAGYFLHERLWLNIRWGKVDAVSAQKIK